MGDGGVNNFELTTLISWSDDLVRLLNDGEDVGVLEQLSDDSHSLQSQCDTDFEEIQRSIEDCEKKVVECKHKTVEANSEASTDAAIDSLQKELEDKLQRENMLREELRVIAGEINGLIREGDSIEDRRKCLKQLERNDSKEEMKLSLFASVTNVIPCLDDQSKTSGYIVQGDKFFDRFCIDPKEMSELEPCNYIWKMINS